MESNKLIIVRGAGDISSGIIWNLVYAGYKVICLDINEPSCIRREVSFSEAIFDGEKEINGVKCIKAKDEKDALLIVEKGYGAVLVDEKGDAIKNLKPDIVIDAILAKRNLGTTIDMAPLVVGVGPGFTAGVDCHYVVETFRSHKLGWIFDKGSALKDTGTPGLIGGFAKERVMHSPAEGYFRNKHKISDIVNKGEVLSEVEECIDGKKTGNMVPLYASLDGVLRGILRDGFYAKKGLKCADIDPRGSEVENCFIISDKARCIGGSVLTLVAKFYNKYNV